MKKVSFTDIFNGVIKFLTLVSLTLGIYLCFRNCDHDKELDRLKYEEKALRYKPQMNIVGVPELLLVWPILDTTAFLQNMKQALKNPPALSDSFFLSTFLLKTKVRFVNSGDYIASVKGYCLSDTLSGDEIIIERLLDNKVILTPIADYYQVKQIKPLDTMDLVLDDTIHFLSNDSFTLHYLLLYEGVKGTLYYSYYWVRYSIRPFLPVNAMVSMTPKGLMLDYRMSKSDVKELLVLKDKASSWQVLTEDKVKRIEEIFHKAHN